MDADRLLRMDNVVLGTLLDTLLLNTFLIGIYTIVYIATIYLYVTRGTRQRKTVTIALSSQYVLYLLWSGYLWSYADLTFVAQGESKESMLTASLPFNLLAIGTVTACAPYLIANGLMFWRCFHIYGRSRCRIIPLGFFFLSEIILTMINIPRLLGFEQSQSHMTDEDRSREARIADITTGCRNVAAVITSALATVMICHRIMSVDRDRRLPKRYVRIMRMVIESSMLFSMSITGMAVLGFLEAVNKDVYASTEIQVIAGYWAVMTSFIAALSPTLMVARTTYSARINPDGYSDPSAQVIGDKSTSQLSYKVSGTNGKEGDV